MDKQDILNAARDPQNKAYLLIDGLVYHMENDKPHLVKIEGEPVRDAD